VPALHSFDFATIRVVPRVEREEFVNAGVIVFCLEQKFLQALVHVDDARILALCPDLDLNVVRQHLDAFPNICAGQPDAGPIARLSLRERFQWLVAPRSTVIQISPVHSGLCELPEAVLHELFRQLVLS
jgi:Protein of unknown function (DUF3037)